MVRAVDLIISAYERCNRLSPGETLSADDAAFGLRRLNELVDEMSAQALFLFRSTITEAAQTGHITLGSGAWAGLSAGEEVISVACNGMALSPMTMRQFNEIGQQGVTGAPQRWAHDGFTTVYLWPIPTGQVLRVLTHSTVREFADQGTNYTVPDGYRAAMAAALAVRIAPNIIGGVPPELLRAERAAMGAIDNYEPSIIDAQPLSAAGWGSLLLGGAAAVAAPAPTPAPTPSGALSLNGLALSLDSLELAIV